MPKNFDTLAADVRSLYTNIHSFSDAPRAAQRAIKRAINEIPALPTASTFNSRASSPVIEGKSDLSSDAIAALSNDEYQSWVYTFGKLDSTICGEDCLLTNNESATEFAFYPSRNRWAEARDTLVSSVKNTVDTLRFGHFHGLPWEHHSSDNLVSSSLQLILELSAQGHLSNLFRDQDASDNTMRRQFVKAVIFNLCRVIDLDPQVIDTLPNFREPDFDNDSLGDLIDDQPTGWDDNSPGPIHSPLKPSGAGPSTPTHRDHPTYITVSLRTRGKQPPRYQFGRDKKVRYYGGKHVPKFW